MVQRALPAALPVSRDMNNTMTVSTQYRDHWIITSGSSFSWWIFSSVFFLCAYLDLVSSYFVRFIENSKQKSRCERTRCAPSCR